MEETKNQKANNNREKNLINQRIKEIRDLNNQENELINNRFTWMGVIQGLIITAYVTILNKYFDTSEKYISYLCILIVLSILGALISLSFNHTFALALSSLRGLRNRYIELIKKLNTNDNVEWPIAIGLWSDIKDIESVNDPTNESLDPWFILPKVFIAVWFFFFVLTIHLFFIKIFYLMLCSN